MKTKFGFSVVEVILAAGLFVAFASATIVVALQGFDANRLGSEQTVANQYAAEGLEAARSIRNQAYANLVDSAGTGLTRNASNVWAFSGANNTFGKYTRVIKIESVNRDVSGNIVASGGTLDTDTKKITSTVSWNVIGTRNNSVILISYLTNWKAALTITTCAAYCQTLGPYTTGTCRNNRNQCTSNGETYQSGGDQYCSKVCCCN